MLMECQGEQGSPKLAHCSALDPSLFRKHIPRHHGIQDCAVESGLPWWHDEVDIRVGCEPREEAVEAWRLHLEQKEPCTRWRSSCVSRNGVLVALHDV